MYLILLNSLEKYVSSEAQVLTPSGQCLWAFPTLMMNSYKKLIYTKKIPFRFENPKGTFKSLCILSNFCNKFAQLALLSDFATETYSFGGVLFSA